MDRPCKGPQAEKDFAPNEFDRDILGIRTQSINHLFSPEIVAGIQKDYTLPVTPEQLEKLTAGRKYYIGAGLDRAKNLIKTRLSDSTVWTSNA